MNLIKRMALAVYKPRTSWADLTICTPSLAGGVHILYDIVYIKRTALKKHNGRMQGRF